MSDEYLEWLLGRDRGISSETIFGVMVRIALDCVDVPHDPADFGRCYRLLERFPEWKQRLQEMAEAWPAWAPFVREWSKMEEIYLRDLPTGRSDELFEFMRKLEEEAFLAAGWTITQGIYGRVVKGPQGQVKMELKQKTGA